MSFRNVVMEIPAGDLPRVLAQMTRGAVVPTACPDRDWGVFTLRVQGRTVTALVIPDGTSATPFCQADLSTERSTSLLVISYNRSRTSFQTVVTKLQCEGDIALPLPHCTVVELCCEDFSMLNFRPASQRPLQGTISPRPEAEEPQPPEGSSQAPVPAARVECAECGRRKQLQKCARCRGIHYCSAECQKEHWKVHKPDCKKVAAPAAAAGSSQAVAHA